MTRNLTTLLLLACLLGAGCSILSGGRQSPGNYDGGNSDSWTGQPQAPWPTNASIMPPAVIRESRITEISTPTYDEMTPVSYKPMSVVITPKLPPCPPLHWEASNGWGGIVISGPDLSVLDWNHTGCPQYPNICAVRAWLTETTDYVLPVQTSGQEFARIIPFETE